MSNKNEIEGKKLDKKNLRCTVCGARAFGYNFDQITCESCKGKALITINHKKFNGIFLAFFRRNALRNMVKKFFEFLFVLIYNLDGIRMPI
jgi:ribosomal protein L37E